MRIEHVRGNPIIRPHMDTRMGTNINAPSLICVPHWIVAPLGTYYLSTLLRIKATICAWRTPTELLPHLAAQASGQHHYEAETYRLKGDLLLRQAVPEGQRIQS